MTENLSGNQVLQDNTTVSGKKETAGIAESPQGEIERDGCPAGAGCTGRNMNGTTIDHYRKTLVLSTRGSIV
jgi:hypothetical protein